MLENKNLRKFLVVFVTLFMIFVLYMSFKTTTKDTPIIWTNVGIFCLTFITVAPLLYKAFLESKIVLHPKKFRVKFMSNGNSLNLELGIISKYQPVTLKNVKVKLENKEINLEKEFNWELLFGYNIQMVGNSKVDNYSLVLPIYNIKENESYSFNASFTNENQITDMQNLQDKYKLFYENIKSEISKLNEDEQTRKKLYELTESHSQYNRYLEELENKVLWQKGEYNVKVNLEFLDKTEVFDYKFTITNEDYLKLKGNSSKIIMAPLLNYYFSNGDNESYYYTDNIPLVAVEK